MGESLRDMLPQTTHDTDRAEALVSLGYPAVDPIIPELLAWMRDMNWPVASVLAPLMSSIGTPLAPHLRAILLGEDDIWKAWMILCVIAPSPGLARALFPELERIAEAPTVGERAEEADQAARNVLLGL